MANPIEQHLGHYRLLRLLGKGGFAEVYLGEHIHLETEAAIKLIHAHLASEDTDAFRREARTIARLKHPHIVPVLDFGIEGGTPYLVMGYAPNGTLRSQHPRGSLLPLPTILSYVKQVADALQYAHDEHVIHRDVKPENILVGQQQELLLGDFGIALLTQTARSQSMQEIAGTAIYMAPEQFQGKPCPASDQYALAVVVYEWFCGIPPFVGNWHALYHQHLNVAPQPLHEHISDILPTVEAVIKKALAKEPKERFSSVSEFVEELAQASSVLPTVTAPSTEKMTASNEDTLIPARLDKYQQNLSISALQHYHIEHEVSWQSLAWSPNGVYIAVGIEGRGMQLWDTRSRTLFRTYKTTKDTPFTAIVWAPDEQHIALVSEKKVQVWDVNTGQCLITHTDHKERVSLIAWAPDGRRIASGSHSEVQVWDTSLGQQPFIYTSHKENGAAIAWAPDGQRIASTLHSNVQIWEAATGKHLATYPGHTSEVETIAWAPDGQRIASGSKKTLLNKGAEVQVWDAITGQHLCTYTPSSSSSEIPSLVMWAPDGRHITLLQGDKTTEVWEVETGRLVTSTRSWRAGSWGKGPVAWMPDGRHIGCVSYDGTVQMWDTGANVRPIAYANHKKHVLTLAWAPDGQRIVSSGYEGVQVWDANTGRHLITYAGHKKEVRVIAWAPDGQRIASGSKKTRWSKGAEVQVWDARTGQHLCTYTGHKDDVTALVWALPDGWRIASSSRNDGTIEVWEASTGQHLTTYTMEGRQGRRRVEALAWAPDGKRIVFLGSGGGEPWDELEVWETDTGRTITHTSVYDVRSWGKSSVSWAPDGQNIALISDRGTVQVHGADLASSITYTYEGKMGALAWMLDGWRIAMASYDGTIRVW